MPDHNFLTKRHHTSLSFLSIHSQNIWEILSRAVGLFLFHVFKVAFSASLLPVFIDLCVSKGAFYFFFERQFYLEMAWVIKLSVSLRKAQFKPFSLNISAVSSEGGGGIFFVSYYFYKWCREVSK